MRDEELLAAYIIASGVSTNQPVSLQTPRSASPSQKFFLPDLIKILISVNIIQYTSLEHGFISCFYLVNDVEHAQAFESETNITTQDETKILASKLSATRLLPALGSCFVTYISATCLIDVRYFSHMYKKVKVAHTRLPSVGFRS